MAVYCGVCAARIDSASENGGSFKCDATFDGVEKGRISDTCEYCEKKLRLAVSTRAAQIAKLHRPRIDALKKEIQGYRDREAKTKQEEAEFRRAWERKLRGES